MADTSPLVNLDLVNKIYKTINAQINERVYDPHWNSEAALGDAQHPYTTAYVGKLNDLTLTANGTGFAISGGTTTPKTLTVADTVTVNKPLTVGAADTGAVTIKSGGAKDTTIIGPDNGTATLVKGTYTSIVEESFDTKSTASTLVKRDANKDILVGKVNGVTLTDGTASFTVTGGSSTPKTLTVNSSATLGSTTATENGAVTIKSVGTGATTIIGPSGDTAQFNVRTTIGATSTNTGAVTIKSSSSGATTITGPSSKEATLIDGTYTTSATTSNSTTPTEGNLLKIKKISANQVLIGPTSDGDAVPTYRKLASNDLPTVPCSKGGTNITSYNKGDILYASANNTLSALSKGSDGQVLKISNGVPTWGTDNNDNTKNTAGANSTTEKIYLIGAKSQGDNPQTYSDKNVYAENGNLYASAVHNAVWNDLADCIEVPEDTNLEFGYCYSWNGGKVEKTSRRSKNYIGIHSNTAGLFMGEKPVKTIQAAVAGFVLAHIDKVYPEGTPLTWSDDGKLTKCTALKRVLHPEKVVATFYKEETQESWYGVKVDNRHWVKVR